MIYDCTIIGGGPAGLNAALVLGRARRSVALFDNNQPRNAVTHASHGFLTRDGVSPTEFRHIAYEEVLRYPSVEHRPAKVTDIRKVHVGFQIITDSDEPIRSRKLLIAIRKFFLLFPALQRCTAKAYSTAPIATVGSFGISR